MESALQFKQLLCTVNMICEGSGQNNVQKVPKIGVKFEFSNFDCDYFPLNKKHIPEFFICFRYDIWLTIPFL